MKITIEWVEANGFRAFQDSVRFEFGEENRITGPNGSGKSSIMEAISFAVTGCDKEGKSNAADRLITKGCSEMSLSVGILVGDKSHRIDRYIVKHKNKTETTVFLDNVKSNQDLIDALVVNKKHFLSSFLLDYFCLLETKEAREQMMSLLPQPSQETVMEELSEDEAWAVTTLDGAKLNDPDVYIQREQTELKGFKEELLRTEGEVRAIEDALKIEIPMKVGIDRQPVENLRESISAIEQAKPKEKDVTALEQQLTQLRAEHRAIQSGLNYEEDLVICEKCGHINNRNAEQEARNAEIIKRMGEIDQQIEKLLPAISAIHAENASMLLKFEEANSQSLALLRGQLKELEANISIVERQNMSADVLAESRAKALERSLSIQSEQANLNKYIQNTEKRIKAAQAFKVKKCEVQIKAIEEKLDRVKIRLFDVTKSTGEIKPTFKLEYDGKEYRVLSTSEKARCGLEISRLICQLTGHDMPVFMDNGESITHYTKPGGQLFTATVVPNSELLLEVAS